MIDAHLHLQMPPLLEAADEVVARAVASGVRRLVVNGTRPGDWPLVATLAKRFPQVIPCFGVHPWEASTCEAGWDDALERFVQTVPSAVGEVGLDRWIEPRDEGQQERVFRSQLALARRLRRPVMVHCLRAWDALERVLREEGPLPQGLLLHAYGGAPELIPHLCVQGAYFSFSGMAFEAKRRRARDALQAVPTERLLLETDAPDMLPPAKMHPRVMRREDGTPANEPANLPLVYAAAAELRGVSLEQLRQQVWQNAQAFLGALLNA